MTAVLSRVRSIPLHEWIAAVVAVVLALTVLAFLVQVYGVLTTLYFTFWGYVLLMVSWVVVGTAAVIIESAFEVGLALPGRVFDRYVNHPVATLAASALVVVGLVVGFNSGGSMALVGVGAWSTAAGLLFLVFIAKYLR